METDGAVVVGDLDWAGHLSRQPGSGMTVAAYCRANGLKTYQFLYRRQRQCGAGAGTGGGFVRLHAPVRSGGGVRAEHRSGWTLYVEPGADEATLAKAARVLARA